MKSKKKIIFFVNDYWGFVNFRLNLARFLISKGCEVILLCPKPNVKKSSSLEGISHIELDIKSTNKNPFSELKVFFRTLYILILNRPDFLLSFTIKPNIYGGIISRLIKIQHVKNVTGIGREFLKEGIFTKLLKLLYRIANGKNSFTFFQNSDDMKFFMEKGLVRPSQYDILPGSGVDTDKFSPTTNKKPKELFNFLMVSRLLWSKGLNEFIQAIKNLKKEGCKFKATIVGFSYGKGADSISSDQISRWIADDLITFENYQSDVRLALNDADCVVLPSYREGMPRSILESSSMQIPVIVCDVPGSREAVDNGKTGLICKARDPLDLALKMKIMLSKSEIERKEMGRKGRIKMLKGFKEELVISKYWGLIK